MPPNEETPITHSNVFPDNQFNGIPEPTAFGQEPTTSTTSSSSRQRGPPPVGMFAQETVWDIFSASTTTPTATDTELTPVSRHAGPPTVGIFLQQHQHEKASGLDLDLDALAS